MSQVRRVSSARAPYLAVSRLTTRALVGLLALLLLVEDARAVPPPPSAQPDPHALMVRRRRARLERGFGLGLAALGIGSFAAGGALLGISGQALYERGSLYETWGWTAIGAGVVLIVPGVFLAIHGQNSITDVDWRMRVLAGSYLVPVPGGAVAGFGLRF